MEYVHYYRYILEEHPGLLAKPSLVTIDLRYVNCPKCTQLFMEGR